MQENAVRIAIIGGGVSGLASGYFLRQAGIESFTIFERSAEIGGRTKVADVAGERVPAGAGVVYIGTETDELCRELGIRHYPLAARAFSCYYRGVTVVAETDGQLVDGLPLTIPAKAELTGLLLRIREDYDNLADHGLTAASETLRSRVFSDYIGAVSEEVRLFLHSLIYPSCMLSADQISAQYAVRYLVSKLMRDGNHAAFIPTGMQEIAFRLHARVQDKVRRQTSVRAVTPCPGGYELLIDDGTDAAQRRRFTHVIMAVAGPDVATLVPTLPAWKKDAIEGVGSISQLIVAAVIDGDGTQPWHDLFFTPVEGLSFDYISDCRAGTGLSAGRALWEMGLVGERAVAAFTLSDDEIVDTWKTDMEKVFPGSSSRLLGAHVQRWPACFSFPKWDRERWLPSVQQPYESLYFAGDYASQSAGTHGAIGSARRVVRQLLDLRGPSGSDIGTASAK